MSESKVKLNNTEIAVLNHLPVGGMAPVSLKKLIVDVQRSNRSVRRALETLKEKGVPIVADFRASRGTKGYFIATTEEERDLIASYEKMGHSILKQAALIRNVDLENWSTSLDWQKEEREEFDLNDR